MAEVLQPQQVPDLPQILNMLKGEVFSQLNCVLVGTIVLFDPTTQTATVKVNFQRKLGDRVITFPELSLVPVFVLGGSLGHVNVPVFTGDTCILLFNDRDLDRWHMLGATATPNSDRMHDFSDAIALVGIRPLSSPHLNYSASDIGFRHVLGGKALATDRVEISSATGNLLTSLQSLCTALTSWVDTRGDTPNAATITAINAVKTQLATILK